MDQLGNTNYTRGIHSFKTTELMEISDKNVFTSTSDSMTFALATPELGFSTYLILLLSLSIWLGAAAYFLFKSDNQKSAFQREAPSENRDGQNLEPALIGEESVLSSEN